jgi:uncharacterized protein YecE (DUF72 family)
MRMFVGTAGWNVPAQYAGWFPQSGTHLQRYATRLNAVEINSSFYRPHRRQTYERWAASVPDTFRFAVKLPKLMTHEHRLTEFDEPMAQFLAESAGLGVKLGVYLVQLPPSLGFDAELAGAFFSRLRELTRVDVACEPRHGSWFSPQADALMTSLRVARVAADPALVPDAAEPGGWPSLVYYRWHGSPRVYYSNYEAAALETLRLRLNDAVTRGTAWCIFDNTAAFAALGNALAIAGS